MDDIGRALEDGARRSREAQRLPGEVPLPLRLWQKHRWLIIALALFLLIDILVMGAISGVGGHL